MREKSTGINPSKPVTFSRGLLLGALGALAIAVTTPGYAESGNEWTVYGGDYSNTRFSTLDQINRDNVKNLKVAWMQSLGSAQSQESTPLVIDGKLYISTSSGPAYVFAFDAKDGTMLMVPSAGHA
jgi:glucose dehydrogenase